MAETLLQKFYQATWGQVFAKFYDSYFQKAEQAGLSSLRSRLLAHAKGKTLEIGAGTGLNLPHYPAAVTELVLTEPSLAMRTILEKKIRPASQIKIQTARAESLPFPLGSFDTVVATFVLCTAPPTQALAEIVRVLKPGGRFLFLEHIRSHNPALAKKQDLIQPLWQLFANGCHCNRRTDELFKLAGFKFEMFLTHSLTNMPWNVRPIIAGVARL